MEPSFSDNTMMAERHEENLENNFGMSDGEGRSALKESIVNHDNGRHKAVSLSFFPPAQILKPKTIKGLTLRK